MDRGQEKRTRTGADKMGGLVPTECPWRPLISILREVTPGTKGIGCKYRIVCSVYYKMVTVKAYIER